METIAEQFIKQLVNVFDQTKSSNPVLTTPTQLLYPASSWNWEVTAIGAISADQFYFADKMPQSSEPGTTYTASGSSFSQSFRSFLDILPCKFPQNLLKSAKANIAIPTGNPANDQTPCGWTKVSIAGITRWEPIYTLSESASQWKLDVESGTIKNPATIVINIKGTNDSAIPNLKILSNNSDESKNSLAVDTTAFEKVSITAESWGQISVYLGSWFDSTIITLAPTYGVSKDTINSLLSARVSAFYVAYKPVFNFSSSAAVSSKAISEISNASKFYALGVEVGSPVYSENNKSVSFTATSPDPLIVAVVIETFP